MTESEAKANIKTYAMVEAENLPKGMGKALDKAIKALEKQIPKKSKLKLCGTIDCSDKDCLSCDRDVERCPDCNEDLSIEYGLSYKHCPNCGQRLDWSDEE